MPKHNELGTFSTFMGKKELNSKKLILAFYTTNTENIYLLFKSAALQKARKIT